jgi:hypothetical protein
MSTIRTACILLLALWMSLFGISEVSAQQPSPSLDALGAAYHSAESAHLWRVAVWGGVNALGGMALMASAGRSAHPARWGFGMQSTAWGVINVGIATAGLFAAAPPPAGADALLDAERSFHDILLFNLGLNVAYSSVGAAMVTASYQGVDHARAWRGHGSALILQGLGLLVLDGIAFFASRARLADLLRVTGDLSARALPMGVMLTLSV